MKSRLSVTATCLLMLSFARTGNAADFGRTLSDGEVVCEENQGHRLLLRMGTDFTPPNLFVWRSAASGGVYRGLLAPAFSRDLAGHFLRDEQQMAFDLIFKDEEDFLNPARRRLPQATLVRRETAFNLKAGPPGTPTLSVKVDLVPDEDPTLFQLPLKITNEPGKGRDDRAGRGVTADDLTSACHDQVSDFDLKVASVLSRTVRAFDCVTVTPTVESCQGSSYKAVVFRGQDPLSYRMDLFRYAVVGLDNGQLEYFEFRLALLFRFQVDGQGRLSAGDVQLLPECKPADQPNCTRGAALDTIVLVLPPIWPGRQTQGPEVLSRGALLKIRFFGDPAAITSATINWADLLKDSTWNQ